MARSAYVYVAVLDGALGGDPPAATFTVKHELVRWAARTSYGGRLRFFRMPDGRASGAADITDEVRKLMRAEAEAEAEAEGGSG